MSTLSPQSHKRTDGRQTDRLDETTRYHLLANDRRRMVVRILRDSGPMDKGTLAERIAAIEAETTPDAVGYETRHAVYVTLHQTHLPKLTAAGICRETPDGYALGPRSDAMLGAMDTPGLIARVRGWF